MLFRSEIPDALGYMNLLTENGLLDDTLAEPFDFDVSTIKPGLALVKKVTCSISKELEFCCQILELSGCDKAKLSAADSRSFRSIMPSIIQVFTPAAKT